MGRLHTLDYIHNDTLAIHDSDRLFSLLQHSAIPSKILMLIRTVKVVMTSFVHRTLTSTD